MGATATSSYEHTVCKNCGNIFQGSFCNTCGQKASVARITWNSIMHYLLHAFFHLDDGFFYTIRQMIIRPGHTIREYLEGKRQAHYNPFLMLLLLAGICSILFVHFHFQTILAEVSLDKLEVKNSFVAHKFFFARTIFFCLLCSVGDYLIFHNRQYSFAEMVVANVFMFSEITFFQLLLVPVLLAGRYFSINPYIRVGFILFVMAYLFFCHYQFYNARGKPKLIVEIILALLCYLAAIVVIGNTIVRPFFN